jgi:hypothetical protein
MKSKYYKQCKLNKDSKYLVTWIPTKLAKVDKVLDIKRDENWLIGWKINE